MDQLVASGGKALMRLVLSILVIGAGLGIALLGMLGLPGRISHLPPVEIYSDRYMPGMDRQPKLRPQEPNAFFTNGVSSQLPPSDTVARSEPIETVHGKVYAFEDSPVNTGYTVGMGDYIDTNPLPITMPLLQRGRERFDIYCAPCHGRLGDGNGITKKIGDMPAVANLHDKRFLDMADGELFVKITSGRGLMPPFGSIIPTEDRWTIVAYLRALQLSWLGSSNDLAAVPLTAPK